MVNQTMTVDIGIDEAARKSIADGLSRFLADSYTLYLKTHNYHWNVTGPMFHDLHVMFEEHYEELAVAVDDIAERIRTLGYPAPGTYKEFGKLTSIEEIDGSLDAKDMVRDLVKGHETVVRTAREILVKAQEANDESTAALLSDRMSLHEKTAWMLRSIVA